jgi:hypothetical protein
MTRPGSADVLAIARAGAMFLAAGAASRALEWVFSSRPILAVVIGAFLLDLWAQRLGARWMPPGDVKASSFTPDRLALGVGTGLGLGLVVVLASAGLGVAHVSMGRVSAMGLGIGVVRVAAYAFRDELLLRGVPLALVQGHVPPRWAIAFCTALGVAPLVLSATSTAALVLGAASALFFAMTWQLGAGGFGAWAAHTGWRIAIEVVAGGSVLDVVYDKGALPSVEGASGLPAYLAAAAFLAASAALYRRTK